uniref:Transposable element P transposase n=1 Tax=Amphimedon queenslandica TaxID=400682 RepID=A0A1X7SX00_AMPQE
MNVKKETEMLSFCLTKCISEKIWRFDKNTGELIGFTSLGDISNQLESVVNSPNDSDLPPELLSNSMMTFMVKGLFSRLEFPYVYFPSRNVTGYLLFGPFWEAIGRLERNEFHVLGSTSDGASINRRLIRLHSERRYLIHKTLNPYVTDNTRCFFFFSDPPHLLKTVRNCWASPTRNLWKDGKEISWDHLKDIYSRSRSESGLILLPRLKYEHLNLTNFSKMRVDLAANVLSESVSKALTLYGGEAAQETAHFVDIFDKFFDCLNVGNFTDGKRQKEDISKSILFWKRL